VGDQVEESAHSTGGRTDSNCERGARPYLRRRPEDGVLHRVLRENLETFLAEARCAGEGLPSFVEQEPREFLSCGVLARGFARYPRPLHEKATRISCPHTWHEPMGGGATPARGMACLHSQASSISGKSASPSTVGRGDTMRGIFCILPPHMLKEIARRGSDRQRDWALRTLTISEQLRGRRQAFAAMMMPRPTPQSGRRMVYDARHGSELPGRLIREEGGKKSRDPAVNEAYDGAGATYALYREVFARDSVDGRGMRLDSTVHYGRKYDNAFWNGEQMVYGDGDGDLFNRFTIAVDVIGHELTHGVTQYEAGLEYQGQSGALNESFSDVFGSLVKQSARKESAAKADWLIGAGLLASGVKGKALRSMKAPGTAYDDDVLGKDPQPAHMKDYVGTDEDNGGVHINSGIPNRAFYEAAIRIGGRAWERAGRIWYLALRDKLRARSTFRDAARLTVAAAGEVYGMRGRERKAVVAAWKVVGISV
jgi:Zn-dependent metalloprotease